MEQIFTKMKRTHHYHLYTKVTIDSTNSRPTSNVYAEDTVEIIFAFLVGRYAGAC